MKLSKIKTRSKLGNNTDGSTQRYLVLTSVLILIYALPALAVHYSINEHFFSNRLFDEWWNILRLAKIAIFSMSVSGAYLLLAHLLKGKSRSLNTFIIVFSGCYFFGSLVILNYYQFFGDLIHFNQIGAAKNLSEIAGQIYHQIIDSVDIALICVLPAGMYLSWKHFDRDEFGQGIQNGVLPRLSIILCLIGLGFWGVQIARYGSPARKLDVQGEVMTASHFGLITAYASMALESQQSFVEVDYPGPIHRISADEPTVFPEPPNIIFLQIESLDTLTTELSVANKHVMPFLNSLKDESVYFENFFSHHNGGGSSDAEIATLMSLLPISSHSGLKTAQYDKIDSLIQILKENNYTTGVFHSNKGSFYNRAHAYSNFGVDHFYDASAFDGEAAGWYAKDKEFYKQSVELLTGQNNGSPFFAYLISIQSHGPFRNYSDDTYRTFDVSGFSEDRLVRDYVLTMHEVDAAISSLFADLDRNRWLENTVIFIFGDHPSGVFSGEPKTARVPLYIWHDRIDPSFEKQPASLIDLAPTVSSLAGFRYGRTWLGSSLLTDENRTVLLRNRSTIDMDESGSLVVNRDSQSEYLDHIKYSDYLLMGH